MLPDLGPAPVKQWLVLVLLLASCTGSTAVDQQVTSPTTVTTRLAQNSVAATSVESTATSAPHSGRQDVLRVGSDTVLDDGVPSERLEDAELTVSGSCVTATTSDHTYLLVWLPRYPVWVEAGQVHISFGEGWETSIMSGTRYSLRGIPDPFAEELVGASPAGCAYDSRFVMFGALQHSPRRLPTLSMAGVTGFPAIGTRGTVSIEGPCVTVAQASGLTAVLVWPTGAVGVLPDGSVHMSYWEALTEKVVRDGDRLSFGGSSGTLPDVLIPDECVYDEAFLVWEIRSMKD